MQERMITNTTVLAVITANQYMDYLRDRNRQSHNLFIDLYHELFSS